jgi:hypothetical protein
MIDDLHDLAQRFRRWRKLLATLDLLRAVRLKGDFWDG